MQKLFHELPNKNSIFAAGHVWMSTQEKKKMGYQQIRETPNTDAFYAVVVRTLKLILGIVVKEFILSLECYDVFTVIAGCC